MYIDSTDNSGMVMVSILSAVTLAVVLVGVGYVVWAAARHRRPGNESLSRAGWHADPFGRHDLRHWDGLRWTAEVMDGDQRKSDPAA